MGPLSVILLTVITNMAICDGSNSEFNLLYMVHKKKMEYLISHIQLTHKAFATRFLSLPLTDPEEIFYLMYIAMCLFAYSKSRKVIVITRGELKIIGYGGEFCLLEQQKKLSLSSSC